MTVPHQPRALFYVLHLLANYALSISQGGHNTVMGVLAAKVRAVIADYAGGKETEQTQRAGLLLDRGALQVAWGELSPERLARAVGATLDGPRPDAAGIKTDGASVSAALLAGLVTARLSAVS